MRNSTKAVSIIIFYLCHHCHLNFTEKSQNLYMQQEVLGIVKAKVVTILLIITWLFNTGTATSHNLF